jgi:hypothetical protein
MMETLAFHKRHNLPTQVINSLRIEFKDEILLPGSLNDWFFSLLGFNFVDEVSDASINHIPL